MKILKPFLSTRFLKFGTVGLSGVFVNLGFFYLLHQLCGLQQNLASALAIEISILSNFLINELWTFRDHREGSFFPRLCRFQLVSLLGAALQWTVFIAMNLLWFSLGGGDLGTYFEGSESFFARYILRSIEQPPEVGNLKYLSQIIGIGVATVWNFLANFYWTWKTHRQN